ncbi:MAG TPA: hypothetical protein VMW49_02735 [Candidatus Dormibacteraeota bacterium]|nr:hypothetical protein [Candidatus Dormibacteraeota bacterium]
MRPEHDDRKAAQRPEMAALIMGGVLVIFALLSLTAKSVNGVALAIEGGAGLSLLLSAAWRLWRLRR